MAKNRTDRLIILLAILLLITAGGAFYFDQYLFGAGRARGERIGQITSRTGDVRMKYQDDLKWSSASQGQDLAYDDAVYAGAGSEAKLAVGKSQLTVTENSLVVLRRDQDTSFLNLNYGNLFGYVAKDEKIVIDTGDGKKLELQAVKNTQIVLRRHNGKTQLDVQTGEAKVNVDGKHNTISSSERLVFGRQTPPKVDRIRLKALKPLSSEVVASREPTRIEFQWEWENGRHATDDEDYVIEFSATHDFKELHAKKAVHAALTSSMAVSQSLSLYYRVRGPGAILSQVERVRFLRIENVNIVEPVAKSTYETDPKVNADVDFKFERPVGAQVQYQISTDQMFSTIAREKKVDLLARESLPVGEYFARARADYGGSGLSDWSETRAFKVTERPQPMPLALARPAPHALIPNREYPSELYGANPSRVRRYLEAKGFLKRFYPLKAEQYDQVLTKIDGDDAEYASASTAWPREKLGPGEYTYSYRTQKSGFLPSNPSEKRKLDIAMEPVRAIGDTTFGNRGSDDLTPAEWKFTPLLFAKSYDVEIARTPTFQGATTLHVDEPSVKTKLAEGSYFWRARARDEKGRLISGYSPAVATKPVPPRPMVLAKREVAQEKPEVVTKVIEKPVEKPWERNGWYAWVGTGENYTKYNQSISDRGAADYHQIRPGSQYFEGGYTSLNGIGGVLTYKGLPGQVDIDNATVDGNTYRWTTLTVDAMMRRLTSWTLGGNPVVYGFRAGVQAHRTPFLFLDENQGLSLKMNDMTNASVGFLAELSKERWRYYSLLRYQVPLSSRAEGASSFEIRPTFAFDGSLGVSYNLTPRWRLATFFYGQWHQFNFRYATQAITNNGYQSLFMSSLDLRLGYDF